MSVNSSASNPLGYLGIDLNTQPPFTQAARDPTSLDILLPGSTWQNVTTQVIWQTNAPGVWDQIVPPLGGSGALTWRLALPGNQQTSKNSGYMCIGGTFTFYLPSQSNVGDNIEFVCANSSATVTIQGLGAAGQIRINNSVSGSTNKFVSTGAGCAVSLLSVSNGTNVNWISDFSSGGWTPG